MFSASQIVSEDLPTLEKPVKALFVGPDPLLRHKALQCARKSFSGHYKRCEKYSDLTDAIQFVSPYVVESLPVWDATSGFNLSKLQSLVGSYGVFVKEMPEEVPKFLQTFDCRTLEDTEVLKCFSLLLKTSDIKLSDLQRKTAAKVLEYNFQALGTFMEKLEMYGCSGFVSEDVFDSLLHGSLHSGLKEYWDALVTNDYVKLGTVITVDTVFPFLGFLSYKIAQLLKLSDLYSREDSKDILAKLLGVSYYQINSQMEDLKVLGKPFLWALQGSVLVWERGLKRGSLKPQQVALEIYLLRGSKVP